MPIGQWQCQKRGLRDVNFHLKFRGKGKKKKNLLPFGCDRKSISAHWQQKTQNFDLCTVSFLPHTSCHSLLFLSPPHTSTHPRTHAATIKKHSPHLVYLFSNQENAGSGVELRTNSGDTIASRHLDRPWRDNNWDREGRPIALPCSSVLYSLLHSFFLSLIQPAHFRRYSSTQLIQTRQTVGAYFSLVVMSLYHIG